ncbi:hypothetical protein ABZ215_39470, partial [Amycolatopsis sp. NPDC006131]
RPQRGDDPQPQVANVVGDHQRNRGRPAPPAVPPPLSTTKRRPVTTKKPVEQVSTQERTEEKRGWSFTVLVLVLGASIAVRRLSR